jgi:transcriptional regulator with XRE-family HTH domain
MVAPNATVCQVVVAFRDNDRLAAPRVKLRMKRKHYIQEWAAGAEKRQADLVEAVGANKSTVSRWFNKGAMPSDKYLEPLADFLNAPQPADLCIHPDEFKILLEIRELRSKTLPAA